MATSRGPRAETTQAIAMASRANTPSSTRASVRRKRSAMKFVAVAVYCLATLAAVNAQDGTGSAAGSAGGTVGPTTPAPTLAPTSKPPSPTTVTPSPSPSPTTSTPAPSVTTTAPPATTTTTPAPEATTEAPTATPKPSKTKKSVNETASDEGSAVTETAAPEATVLDRSTEATGSSTDATPASPPGSGVSYGGKASDSSSSQANEVSTSSSGDATNTAIQFVVVAAGVLGVVAAVAMSVHFHQKRRALGKESGYDDDDKYLNPAPKRPTTIDVHEPTTTTAAAPSGAVLYDNYTTPHASGWGHKAAVTKPQPPTMIGDKPAAFSAYRDSEDPLAASATSTDTLGQSTASGIVTTAATTGSAATFVGRKAGENDVTGGEEADRATAIANSAHAYVEEDFREPRVTVKHITRCRGQSEASTADGSDALSQFGANLLRSTFVADDNDDDDGYTNTQMFAFSDSGSEGDRDSSRSHESRGAGGAASDVSEFLKFYNGPIVNAQVDVDVDVDVDDEDIIGRSTRASSLFDDVRASDFTVGHTSRLSTSSSIADFHDSMVDRPSELDEEEFEV